MFFFFLSVCLFVVVLLPLGFLVVDGGRFVWYGFVCVLVLLLLFHFFTRFQSCCCFLFVVLVFVCILVVTVGLWCVCVCEREREREWVPGGGVRGGSGFCLFILT